MLFRSRANHGQDDTPSPIIEDSLDVLPCIPSRTGQGNGVSGCDGRIAQGRCLNPNGHVFNIQVQPIETDLGHQGGCGGVGNREPCADAGFSSFELGFDVIGFHQEFLGAGLEARN